MKLSTVPLLFAVGISFTPTMSLADGGITATAIGTAILDRARSQIVSRASSLIVDSIFGSSSGPQFVELSEASLNEIQNRVHLELVMTAEFEFMGDLSSLDASLEYYNATVFFGQPDLVALSNLVLNSNDLVNHYALNPSFNNDYYYLAESFALAASLNVAIYTERFLQGSLPLSVVEDRANLMADTLEVMIQDRKATELPLQHQCRQTSDPYDQDVEVRCTLTDPFGNTIASEKFDPRDTNDRDNWFFEQVPEAEESYYQNRFSALEDYLSELRNF